MRYRRFARGIRRTSPGRHGLFVIATVALAAGVATIGGAIRPADGSAASLGAVNMSARDYYFNLVAPLVLPETNDQEKVDGKQGHTSAGGSEDLQAWWALQQRKHGEGFPRAAKQLSTLEQQAARTGKNPKHLKQSKSTLEARLLTVLVEFNPNANDDFSGFERLEDINGTAGEDCVTEPAGTFMNGPVHGELPDPSTVGEGTDNNTFWVPDFDVAHFEKMLYSTTGITERVRTDLTGPDGQPGFDISGYTMKNMYREMSKGAYDITGGVVDWVMLPHSEAYYAADSCEAGRASMVGSPDNPRGASQIVVDAVTEIAASDPDFPWESYDIEDQGDLDNDGNFNEPDGVVDHFVIVHAGAGEEGGGGAQGVYAVWSHSSVVDPSTGGFTVPGTDMKVFNFIMQPEDAGVGVFAHEYGHDLGLPDLYNTANDGTDSDVEFWDLMNTGSHSGPIFQSIPTNMGAWDKFVLGWIDPLVFAVGDDPQAVQLGAASRTPVGTKDAVRVNLPQKQITLVEPHAGSQAWYSGNDQNWADVKLARTVDVPEGDDVRFWAWDNYVIEDRWDYGFIEVSTDDGETWSQLVVKDEDGDTVSTNEDPHQRLIDYGGLSNGLTASSEGWRHDYVDLTPYAGTTIQLRLRYATDAGFLERGWFADDFSITADGTETWSDEGEELDDWTTELGTFAGTSGAGWTLSTGTFTYFQYYLAEWRNLDGFDKGLLYTYDSDYLRFDTGEWSVQRVPYNAPGMLVWYRNGQYTDNHVGDRLFDAPSTGPKGSLLIVDSHFDPLRRSGDAAAHDSSSLKNIPSRPQASNAAFGVQPTYPFTECLEDPAGSYNVYCTEFAAQPGLSAFTDAKGWAPGLEWRPGLAFRDIDGSVVVPSRDNAVYTTRIVDRDGNPFTPLYGVDLFGDGSVILGSGNPEDGNPVTEAGDLSFGVSFAIKGVKKDTRAATIWVQPAH